MTAVTPLNLLVEQLSEMNDYFMTVASADGLAAVLLAVGTLLIVVSVAVMGYLTAGAAVDLVTRN